MCVVGPARIALALAVAPVRLAFGREETVQVATEGKEEKVLTKRQRRRSRGRH